MHIKMLLILVNIAEGEGEAEVLYIDKYPISHIQY